MWEIGRGNIEAEAVAHREEVRGGVELDGDLIRLSGLHQGGLGARVAEPAAPDPVRDLHGVSRGIIRRGRVLVHELGREIRVHGRGRDHQL